MKRRPAMKKTSTVRANGNMIFKGQKLTLALDLGDHWSCYCVLDEAGKIVLEQKVAITGRNFFVKSRKGGKKEEGAKKKGEVSKQPISAAEIT
jgi:hypothetical protein